MSAKTARKFALSFWILWVAQANAQPASESFAPMFGATVSERVSNGFHLFGATLSAGYSSSLGWLGSTWSPVVTRPIYYEGASILVGYTHIDRRSGLVITYSPSFSGLNGMGGLQFLNQRFSLGYRRNYGPKWTFRLQGEAADTTFQDFLFPAKASDPLSTSLSPVSSALERPVTANPDTLLFGNRQFMYTARAGVEYKPTTRLSLSLDAGVDQEQALRHSNYSVSELIPRARSEVANVALAYSFSTRTQVQTILMSSDTQSPFARYRITTLSEGVLRKLTRRWWLWLQAGAGVYQMRSSSLRRPAAASYTAGGGAGYSGRANTFGFTFNKGIGDSFGLASGSTYGFQGGWNWRRPGSNWGLDAGGMQQRLTGGHLGNFSLWQAGAGVTRFLGGGTYVRAEYAYLLDTAVPYGFVAKPRAHGVRLTFGWNALGHGRPRLGVPTPGPGPTK